MKNLKKPTGQTARWLEELGTYSLTVTHRAGRKHSNADALSRRPCKSCEKQESGNHTSDDETDEIQLEESDFVNQELHENEEPTPTIEIVRICTRSQTGNQSSATPSGYCIEGWDPDSIRQCQLEDPDMSLIVTYLQEKKNKPDWGQRNWDEILPQVMMAYRSSVHASTGQTPNMMMFGRNIFLPMDSVIPRPNGPDESTTPETDKYINELQDAMLKSHQQARRKVRRQRRKERKMEQKAKKIKQGKGDKEQDEEIRLKEEEQRKQEKQKQDEEMRRKEEEQKRREEQKQEEIRLKEEEQKKQEKRKQDEEVRLKEAELKRKDKQKQEEEIRRKEEEQRKQEKQKQDEEMRLKEEEQKRRKKQKQDKEERLKEEKRIQEEKHNEESKRKELEASEDRGTDCTTLNGNITASERARTFLRKGGMPLFPAGRREWNQEEVIPLITLPAVVSWPPKNWKKDDSRAKVF
ncbi:uncharacterized protein LOC127711858 [Mytilus californianus]|uniref:uncharacterized protein LOC127711858 n=1 Tax=Mytilus californianus TaxID=6549 RepID=UPI00224801A9|nr:uncharacterized protein LOC127711858 [Mytilus californianus]